MVCLRFVAFVFACCTVDVYLVNSVGCGLIVVVLGFLFCFVWLIAVGWLVYVVIRLAGLIVGFLVVDGFLMLVLLGICWLP